MDVQQVSEPMNPLHHGMARSHHAVNGPAPYLGPMTTPETIFVEMRKQRGLSQRRLSELLNIDQGSISRMERGEASITFDVALRWAEACSYSITVGPTADGAVSIAGLNPRSQAVIRALASDAPSLSPFQLEVIELLLTGWRSPFRTGL